MNGLEIISPEVLAALEERVRRETGLHYPPEKRKDLVRGTVAAAKAGGYSSGAAFAQALLPGAASRHLDLLVQHLVVGETYFLRDPKVFRALEEDILPALLAMATETGEGVKILSVGCSTGEEVYSIAMIADRVEQEGPRMSILGTDISERVLETARRGIYSSWSLRDAPAWMARYLVERDDGRIQVTDALKERVAFRRLNVATAPVPYPWPEARSAHVIFCRNVLMYFDMDTRRRVVDRLVLSLAPGGYLVLSPADALMAQANGDLERVKSQGASFLRKRYRTGACDSPSRTVTRRVRAGHDLGDHRARL